MLITENQKKRDYTISAKGVHRHRNFTFRPYKVHTDIRGGSVVMGHQMTVGWPELAIFSNFCRDIFGIFRVEANIIIGFATILKCLTLNDLDMPFYVKICLHRRFDSFFCIAFANYYAKMNENTVILPATTMFAGESF